WPLAMLGRSRGLDWRCLVSRDAWPLSRLMVARGAWSLGRLGLPRCLTSRVAWTSAEPGCHGTPLRPLLSGYGTRPAHGAVAAWCGVVRCGGSVSGALGSGALRREQWPER